MGYGTDYMSQALHSGNAVYFTLVFIWALIVVIADWKIFEKAGEAGWKSLIPIYRDYIQFKRFAGSILLFWVYVAGVILSVMPVLWVFGYLIVGITTIILCFRKALSFNRGGIFFLGLLFLAPIFECILGFGSAQYIGPRGSDLGTNFNGFGTAAGAGFGGQGSGSGYGAQGAGFNGYNNASSRSRKPGVDPDIIDVEPINPSSENTDNQ